MDIQQLKGDVAAGKLSIDHLMVVIEAMHKRITELENQIKAKNTTPRLDQSYSEKAGRKRQEKAKRKQRKRKPLRRGRLSTADKVKLAERTEAVYPNGVNESDCKFSHTRVMWRLENG